MLITVNIKIDIDTGIASRRRRGIEKIKPYPP
jgi:hypothetical protein